MKKFNLPTLQIGQPLVRDNAHTRGRANAIGGGKETAARLLPAPHKDGQS